MHHPSDPTRLAEPTVSISMHDDHVVVRARSRLDLDTTGVLVNAVAAALAAGFPSSIETDLVSSGRLPTGSVDQAAIEGGGEHAVKILAAGCIRLTVRDCVWTIDLERARCCRSAGPVDPRFVSAERWTPITGVWVTTSHVTVLTGDDSYWSIPVDWSVTSPHGPRRCVAA